MAALTPQTTTRAGIEPTYEACGAGGDEFANAGGELVHIKNGAGAEQIMTIVSQATVDGLAVADRTVAIPAGEERVVGPFPTATYNDGDGLVQLTYDAVVTLTIGIIKPGT